MERKRKLTELFNLGDKIYIYLKDKHTYELFRNATINEGFCFNDGSKLKKNKYSDIIAIHKNKELCYVGYIGRINFKRENCDITKIDYDKYINNKSNYIFDNKSNSQNEKI